MLPWTVARPKVRMLVERVEPFMPTSTGNSAISVPVILRMVGSQPWTISSGRQVVDGSRALLVFIQICDGERLFVPGNCIRGGSYFQTKGNPCQALPIPRRRDTILSSAREVTIIPPASEWAAVPCPECVPTSVHLSAERASWLLMTSLPLNSVARRIGRARGRLWSALFGELSRWRGDSWLFFSDNPCIVSCPGEESVVIGDLGRSSSSLTVSLHGARFGEGRRCVFGG
ncbi:hypothetical protein ARMGADRAFT_549110 [Armillaria gallica]|uniref:Uncharacterized protein n=1 Tax=Armillaria gallica TaxID=47427 RepID=A0A2H3CUZ3_ARMGA|nr:hypothetical protein ARMGADRAFT_549110 [Armillaria gallica]